MNFAHEVKTILDLNGSSRTIQIALSQIYKESEDGIKHMINILEMNDKTAVGFAVNGTIEKNDIDQVYAEMNKAASSGGKIKLYAEASDFNLGDLSSEALKRDLQMFFKNPGILPKIEKVVLVTNSNLLKTALNVEAALIPTMEGKTFSMDQKNEAKEWLATDQREGKRLDLTVPELAKIELLEGAGGFALGLLTASLFSDKRRKNIGKALLAGTIVASIPLVAKILNNNRQLFA